MDPIRRKLSAFLADAACRGIEALDPESACAKELRAIPVGDALHEDVERICAAASLAEIGKVFVLGARIQKTSGKEKEKIMNDLKDIADELVTRVEKQSGRLMLPELCRHLLLALSGGEAGDC